MEVARSKNTVPLPSVKPHCGLRLPADCYCMTACNYRLKSIKKNAAGGKPSAGSSASTAKMSTLGGVRAVLRPNSPAVRITNAAGSTTASTSTTPRPVVKISTPGAQTATAMPKIQITTAPTVQVDKPESLDVRGIKREREDDDYDAA